MDKKELLERLARIKKDVARTEKKLAKSYRSAKARAHVQRKLREQACESSSTEGISSAVAPSLKVDESNPGFVRTVDAEVQPVVNLQEKIQELICREDKQENNAKSESVGKDLPCKPLKQKCKLSVLTLLPERINRKDKYSTSPEVSSARYEINGNFKERDNESSRKICKNQIEFTQHVVNKFQSQHMNVQSGEITSAPAMMNPETLLDSVNNTPVSSANEKEHSKSGYDRPDKCMGKNVRSNSRSNIYSIGEAMNATEGQSLDSVKPCEDFIGSVNDTKFHVTQKSTNSQIVCFDDNQPGSEILDKEMCSEHESSRLKNMPPEVSCTPEKQGQKCKCIPTGKRTMAPHVPGSSSGSQISNQDGGFTLQDQNCVTIINSSPALSASLDYAEIHSSDLIQDSQLSDSQLDFSMGQGTQKGKKKFSGQVFEPCSKKRQSLRIAVLSSQRSGSQSTSSLGSQNSQTSDSLFSYKRMRKSKNQLIISSVFQYLIDEGKRKNSVENFSLPDEEFEVLLKQKDSCRQNLAIPLHDNKAKKFVQELDSKEDRLIYSPEHERHMVKPDLRAETIDSRFYAPLQEEILYSLEKTFSNDIFKEHVEKQRWTGSHDRQNVKCLDSDGISFQSSVTSIGKEAPYLLDMFPSVFDQDVKSELHSTPAIIQLTALINSSSSPPLALSVPYNLTFDSFVVEEIHNHSKFIAHQGSFQIPQTSHVLCFAVGQLADETQSGFYLACLSPSYLSMWKMKGDKWVNFHTEKIAPIRRTGGSSLHALPSTGSIVLLMLLCCQDKTDLTLNVYSDENRKHQQHHLMSSREKSIKVCPVSDRELIVYYSGKQSSELTKYTLSAANPGVNSTLKLEMVQGRLLSVTTITSLPQAVLGLTSSREVHIWNHMMGSLLVSVDITDICHDEILLYMAIAEQGFVFVPTFSKRSSLQPGSLIVINPMLGTSETLCAYRAPVFNSKWLGCTDCVQYKEFLIVLDNSGKVLIWNLYSGELAAELNDVICTGLGTFGDYLILVHKNCFHVYIFVQN
ncbi:hypothetical protein CHS0354_028254 [Potamilus streckersoni]|uniref:Partner and localiser of BRCA2 WD40 domain-containing protein n=1 Tax=Potamilus streckersoni TaxID=2493646 RepID=A0AAE0RTW7_9BIVA|nr:hypothetical protein CHS0354_028254 [Potamilus streckersoni]